MEQDTAKTERRGDILERVDLSLVSIGHARNVHDWKFQFEGHPFHRLYYLETGSFLLKYFDAEFKLESGSFWLIPAFHPFHYTPLEANGHYYFHFNSSFLEYLPKFRYPLRAPPEAGAKALSAFRSLFRVGYPGKRNMGDKDNECYNLLTCPNMNIPDFFYNEAVEGFSGILKYIDEHIDRDIEVRELYTKAKMCQAKFSAKFRRTFGIPPKQYICSRRICRAKLLLLNSSFSIAEIARRTGYGDEYFFYRIFKKYTGASPGQWRDTFLSGAPFTFR